MKSLLKSIILVQIVLLLFMIPEVFAQNENLTFKHFSSREGLTNVFVWDMFQDKYGYVWIGGNSGLNKFDGYTFTNFRNRPEDPTSFPVGIVLDIEQDTNGDLLIGLSNGFSIYKYSNDNFMNIELPDSMQHFEFIRDIYIESENNYWLTSVHGIYNIRKNSSQPDDFEYYFYPKQNFSQDFSRVTSILPKDEGHFWLGSDEGLFEFNKQTHAYTKFIPSDSTLAAALQNEIWTMHSDQNDNIWIATLSGLIYWENGSEQPEYISTLGNSTVNLRGQPIQSITENEEGKLFFGISGTIGALIYDPSTGETTVFQQKQGDVNSIPENDGHYFFEDVDKNLWFGYHTFGLSIAFDQSWRYEINRISDNTASGLPEHDIHQILEFESGELWFATHLGLIQVNEGEEGFTSYLPNPNAPSPSSVENQFAMMITNGRKILAMSHAGGYYIFDTQTKEFEILNLGYESPPFSKYQVIDDFFYLGVIGDKVLRLNSTTNEITEFVVPPVDSIPFQNHATFVLIPNDSTIYVGYAKLHINGIKYLLYSFDPETSEFEYLPLDLPDNFNSFGLPIPSRTQTNIIWIPTNLGLYRLDLALLQTQVLFQSDAAIFVENTGQMYEDSDGYLWMPNQSGLVKLDPVTQTVTYLQSRPDNGLQVFRTPYQLENGELLVPGIGGYLRFDPDNQVLVADINNIHVTEIRAGSTFFNTLTNSDPIEISHAENNLTFSYLALNYSNPQVTRYRYRIAGYNDTWVEIGTQRMVFLANLPPGTYTFEVQAAQRFGAFGDITATQQFTVLPPWWRTIPAYLMFALIIGGSIFAVDRFQRKRLLTQERERTREKELEQAQKIKVAYANLEVAHENLKSAQTQLIQQEKLASLGQLTAGIAHEIKNPLNFVNNFSSVSIEMLDDAISDVKSLRNDIQKGDKNSEALLKLTDETLHTLNDVRINLSKIHDHGSRADGIVKSMLLHSRGGSGKREAADFNTLVKEYVNLAYHGMRASKFPIQVDIEFELDSNVGNYSVISEDFSRVILNLCNNAFDAMRELLGDQTSDIKTGPPNAETYRPTLKVRTSRDNGSVYLEIEDNGPGIPADIRDKILQPFFTTKKGTMGTGLGLSITHDIIKAHGGELSIQTEPGQTVFTIKLTP